VQASKLNQPLRPIRFAVEDFPFIFALGAWMRVGDENFNADDIRRFTRATAIHGAVACENLVEKPDRSSTARKECFVVLRAAPLSLAVVLFGTSAVLAEEPLAPSEIQTTFFTGQAFTATTPSGTKFKMTFTPDGKMTREPLAQRGNESTGTWKLNAKGFCTT
jgi:hypothetical protein